MDNWKGTLLQVIGILLGSSVVLGFINNFINTLNQPDIQISVTLKDIVTNNHTVLREGQGSSSINYTFLTEIRNVGKSPATNVELQLQFPGYIFPFDSVQNDVESTENFTESNLNIYKDKKTTGITGFLKKLGPGGEILITSEFDTGELDAFWLSVYPTEDDLTTYYECKVIANYDQYADTFTCDKPLFYQSTFYKGEYPLLIFFILFAIFIFVYSWKKLRTYKGNKRKSNFVNLVKQDVFNVFNIFNKTTLSKKIISYDLWNSITENEKRQIFNNYDDYKKIDEFYTELKNRDNSFFYDIDDETLYVYNNKILSLSSDIIKIDWDDYHINEGVDSKPIPNILIILLFSFSLNLIEILSYSITKDFFFPFFIRMSFSSIILFLFYKKKILKDTYNFIISKNNNQSSRSLFFYKIVPFSVGILSIPLGFVFPIFPIIENILQQYEVITSGIGAFRIDSLLYAYILTSTTLIADIGRVFLIFKLSKPRKFTKNKVKPIAKLHLLTGSLVVIFNCLLLIYMNFDFYKWVHFGKLDVDIEAISSNLLFFVVFVLALFFIGILDIMLAIQFLRKKFLWIKYSIITESFIIIFWFIVINIYPLILNTFYSSFLGFFVLYSTIFSYIIIVIKICNIFQYVLLLNSLNTLDILQQRYLLRQEWKQMKKTKKVIIGTVSISSVVIGFLTLYFFILLPSEPSIVEKTSIDQLEKTSIDQHLIPIGISPFHIEVNPNTNMVYVTSFNSTIVSVINGTTNEIIADIDVNDRPQDLSINPNTNMVYVTSFNSTRVSVINGTTNEIIDQIDLPVNLRNIAVNPNTNMIYTSNFNNTTFVINGTSNKVIQDIQVGSHSVNIAVNPNTNMIYVVNRGTNTTSVINGETNKVISNIQVGFFPFGIAVNPNTNMIYVVNHDSNTTSVINGETNKVISNIQVGSFPWNVAVNPNTNNISITSSLSDTVYIINGETNKVISNIQVGFFPFGIAVNPNTNMTYVTNNLNSTVSVFA